MSKPWSIKRQERFWKLCGFTLHKRNGKDTFRCWKDPSGRLYTLKHMPALDMNNLYAYAVKKLISTGLEAGMDYGQIDKIWHAGFWRPECSTQEVYIDPDLGMALATACEKALLAEQKA